MAVAESRAKRWSGLSDDVKLRLIVSDLDEQDGTFREMNLRLNKILWAMVGILISTTTASIMLALNLTVGR